MTAWACHSCLRSVPHAERIEKRIEYRTAVGHRRHRVITVSHLCVACADAEAAQLRPTPSATQERMW